MPEQAPEISFLFRYRDLTADTLPEHKAIIDSKGQCWWGWWKRPTEDGRENVWNALNDEILRTGSAAIGLFDSGSGNVHIATVEAVIKPHMEYGAAQPVTPDATELDLIPEYYRSSRHSRAWLRLTSISPQPVRFFGEYSYRSSPPLPQHPAGQLERLVNKQITDADELRGMDTTIWEVRKKVPGDKTGTFIVALPGPGEPLSSRAIECQGEWLLHLTDLHYAIGPNRRHHRWRLESEGDSALPTMADAVAAAVAAKGRQIGALVVTGDLTFNGSPEEFAAAQAGLRKLTDGSFQLGMEHLVVIPGNHDIRWTTEEVYTDDAPVNVASETAVANYRDFFLAMFRYPANDHLSMARRFLFPGGTLIDIVGVNSSSLETGHDFLAGMGRVQEPGFWEASNALSWNRRGNALRVLALHHHLTLTENLESANEYRSGFGIAIDAPRTQRNAAKQGVHLALHGHKHRAFVWRSGAYELPEHSEQSWDLGYLNILGGGSAGSTATEGGRNYFNLVRYSAGKVEVEMYRADAGGVFAPFFNWEAIVSTTDDGRPVMAPWRRIPAIS